LNNLDFYKNAYKKYGISARGLNWSSDKSQRVRVEVITSLLKDELSMCSIVDAGCGFGDLYLFWQENGLHVKSYVGIDSVKNSIKICTERLPKISFTCKDILKDDLPYADWYIASGTLNILNDFQTWLFLEKILSHSSKGIVFNVLEGSKKSENFNYQKKEDIIAFAKSKGFTCRLMTDYLKNDMTVEIRK
jgi:SAM-dependent methyltransferase